MRRILFVLPSITQTNGVCSFLFNYLRKLDMNKYRIDILATNLRPSESYINELSSLGINLYLISNPGRDGFFQWYSDVRDFFKKNHNYDVVYSNVANQSLFIFIEAKKYQIKNRIIHSHATKSADKKLNYIRNEILNGLMLRFATERIACSQAAGRALYKSRDYRVINNAIDFEKYMFSTTNRIFYRKDMGVDEDQIVIGFVGRFVPQKNIFFFAEIARILPNNYVFLMIGNGPQKEDFIRRIENENTKNRFIFIEECPNVNCYYSAMDIFILPSLFEGLPVSGVEAQVNGLKCLFSTNITEEAKLLESTSFLDLQDADEWVKVILEMEKLPHFSCKDKRFDIKEQIHEFDKLLQM